MGAPVGPATLGLLLALAWLGGTAWQLQQAALRRTAPRVLMALGAAGAAAAAWSSRLAWAGAAVLVLVLTIAAIAFAVISGRAAWRLAASRCWHHPGAAAATAGP